ncbi:MAG: hypothetical protein AAB733_02015 [Patescibacteria group bacterium]|mgnify:CR=1 FL=1
MKRWLVTLCVVLGCGAGIVACDEPPSTSPEPAALDDSGVPADSGSFVPDESPDISLRLGSNDREAVKLECFYALNPSHNGTSGKKINGWTVSDWNYLASDLNAWSAVRDCYGSAWCGLDGNATYSGCSHGGYSWHMIKGSKSCYRYPSAYGYQDGYGRGGQCRYFGNLILYRSGTGKRLPTYTAVINDYNSSPRRYTKLGGEARVGDLLQTKWSNGHTAVVVQILEGREGVWSPKLDVVDANFVGGDGAEIIGRHILDVNASGTSDLDNYIAIDLDKSWN